MREIWQSSGREETEKSCSIWNIKKSNYKIEYISDAVPETSCNRAKSKLDSEVIAFVFPISAFETPANLPKQIKTPFVTTISAKRSIKTWKQIVLEKSVNYMCINNFTYSYTWVLLLLWMDPAALSWATNYVLTALLAGCLLITFFS